MPTDEEDSRGITIQQMITDISTLVGGDGLNTNELTECLKSIGLNPEDITVSLKMAYFYMISDGNDAKNNVTEYAFHMEIDTTGVIPESVKLFNVSKIGFAVWNTERPKIIKQMNLYKPEDLLE